METLIIYSLVVLLLCIAGCSFEYGDYYGFGYSSDTEQIVGPCFNSHVSGFGTTEAIFVMEEAVSYSEVEKLFKIKIEGSVTYQIFTFSAGVEYLREIEDKEYSLSLNYFTRAMQTVLVGAGGTGKKLLTSSAKRRYENEKSHPYFGVTCGDHFIREFQRGATLAMSVTIHFKSHYDKRVFISKAGFSIFGPILGVTAEIKRTAIDMNMEGNIKITAIQFGGRVEELGKILTKDKDGKYYSLKCDISNIDACTKATEGLLDYAVNIFPGQFSFEESRGLTDMGMNYVKIVPLDYMNLEPPKSLVTESVKDEREALNKLLLESKYYMEKFIQLIEGYPVQWVLDGDVYKDSCKMFSRAQKNYNVLLRSELPDKGPQVCFNFPTKCVEESKELKSQLKVIDLSFLKQVKYVIPTFVGKFYPTGGSDPTTSWLPKEKDVLIHNILVNSTYGSFDVEYQNIGKNSRGVWEGFSNDGIHYCGVFEEKTPMDITLEKMEFYFEEYK